MKLITIPDLHGKDYWKNIDFNKYDKVIFLGDYVDSRLMVPPVKELNNLLDIIKLKRDNPDKVELLLGNHDIQYLYFPKYQCSINYQIVDELVEIFNSNSNLFKVAFQIKNHLWTHAGVSLGWLKYYCQHFEWYENLNYNELHLYLNSMRPEQMHLLTTVSESRGGSSYFGGPFWADKSDTFNDRLSGLYQYIGHTKVPEVIVEGDILSSNHYLDCLDSRVSFFSMEL